MGAHFLKILEPRMTKLTLPYLMDVKSPTGVEKSLYFNNPSSVSNIPVIKSLFFMTFLVIFIPDWWSKINKKSLKIIKN